MRILIVEDEERLAKALVEGLTSNGFAVDHIPDGTAAFNRISLYRNEYDVIILDLMLPGASGEEICKAAREAGVKTPILILTAKDDTDSKVSVLNMGADDYLPKPFSFDELLARVNALMRRPNEVVPVTLEIDDIKLDTATHTVTKGDQEITLTLKEFALLEYFMRHPGRALTREDILDHVWDFEFASFSNVVDVHVKNLRKKLGDHNGELIETVRGVGYRLVE